MNNTNGKAAMTNLRALELAKTQLEARQVDLSEANEAVGRERAAELLGEKNDLASARQKFESIATDLRELDQAINCKKGLKQRALLEQAEQMLVACLNATAAREATFSKKQEAIALDNSAYDEWKRVRNEVFQPADRANTAAEMRSLNAGAAFDRFCKDFEVELQAARAALDSPAPQIDERPKFSDFVAQGPNSTKAQV